MPDRYQVMIDIETLGKKPGCVVLSVGAVVMDMEKLKTVARSYWVLDTKEQEHFKIDADTVLWWIQQAFLEMDALQRSRQRLDDIPDLRCRAERRRARRLSQDHPAD